MAQNTTKHRINQVRAAYNTIAGHFSDTRSAQWKIVATLLDEYVPAGSSLLDVGCGNGRVAELAAERTIQYSGSDISEELIALARAKHPRVNFTVADMRRLPYEDNQFDHLISVAAFHHLPDHASRLQALAEMKRVVKPGGFILLTNWNLWQRRYWPLHVDILKRRLRGEQFEVGDTMVPWKNADQETQADRYYHSFRPRELRGLFAAAKLTLVDQYYETSGEKSTLRRGHNMISIVKK